ncbi:MAG TPA: phosphotransferase family protein [Solirubrobacterales bacterium]|nr:phosphotransferase family protein [Solirubrobacterales bacterium]
MSRSQVSRPLDGEVLEFSAALEAALGLRELTIEPVSAGHSNLTYFLRAGDRRLVLRRPPRGPLAPSAHDVLREYRMLAALEQFDVRVPRVVAACSDPAVIGAPFYVMEQVDGVVLDPATPPPFDNPVDRAKIGEEMVDTLLELHRVEWRRSSELTRMGRADGYLERQVRLWRDLWGHQRTREVPLIDAVGAQLARAIPTSPGATLVHGDYKVDNVVFSPAAPPRLVAVLDWEMATIGDPLADLGFLTATWLQGDDPDRLLGLARAGAEEGYPSRVDLVERYAAGAAFPVERLAWYQSLALWKLAILLEGSFGRFKAGTTDDPFFARLQQGVPALAEQAHAALADGPI